MSRHAYIYIHIDTLSHSYCTQTINLCGYIYIYGFLIGYSGVKNKKKKNSVNTSFSTLSFGYSILLLPPSACCSFEEQYIERWLREKKYIYMKKRVGKHYAFNGDGFSFTFLVCVYF